MRITQAARRETRERILRAAESLFAAGYSEASTRAIAERAGIATGTLFNYFPSKEALGFALVDEAAIEAEKERLERGPSSSLGERLFEHVALELRHMEPLRAWIGEVLEACLSPLRADSGDAPGEFRRRHLARVQQWIDQTFGARPERAVDLHLYWSLYLGVVGYWARDTSEHQAATLALLDRSMGLFVQALQGPSGTVSGHPLEGGPLS